jgi:hypothetical protein
MTDEILFSYLLFGLMALYVASRMVFSVYNANTFVTGLWKPMPTAV